MACSLSDELSKLTVSLEKETVLQNILTEESSAYLREGKVMIIMRGVPGSGKSTIVKNLMTSLDTKFVCSADHYFQRFGDYKFDSSKLKEAHEYCQQKVQTFCKDGEKVVIIDNTSISAWESSFYRKLALQYNYMVFIIIPPDHLTTSARVLASRNKHGVDEKTILEKQKRFEDLAVYYYGWFFNEKTAEKIRIVAEKTIKHYQKLTGKTMESYEMNSMFHITALFCDRKHPENNDREGELLNSHIGCLDTVSIDSIVITPKTMAARVKLKDGPLQYFCNSNQPGDQYAGEVSTLAKGDSAHITLAKTQGTKSVAARQDIILSRICQQEQKPESLEGGLLFFPKENLTVINLKSFDILAIFSKAV